MIFTKRVVAPIAFAWTLAAAGMAAVALTAGPSGGARINLEDVQVGERDNQTRIALICDAPCVVEKLGAREFLLRGVDASLDVDLSARADNVSALHASPIDEGALLSVSTAAVIEYANTKSCTVGGRAAACIDLFFDLSSRTQEKVAVAAPSVKTPSAPSHNSAQTAQKRAPSLRGATSAQSIAAKAKTQAPVLREGAPERMTCGQSGWAKSGRPTAQRSPAPEVSTASAWAPSAMPPLTIIGLPLASAIAFAIGTSDSGSRLSVQLKLDQCSASQSQSASALPTSRA